LKIRKEKAVPDLSEKKISVFDALCFFFSLYRYKQPIPSTANLYFKY